jgi:UDPglucose 6-dehydrogenase
MTSHSEIAVLGLGFVGLTTALGFAWKGNSVRGFDVHKHRADSLLRKKIPFHEPGLPEALDAHLGKEFVITDSLQDAVRGAEAIFICVGTPRGDDGHVDLTQINDAISQVIAQRASDKFQTIVIKSTVTPGTTGEKVKTYIESKGLRVGEDIGLAVNPEFLREGKSWYDFTKPDRVVIGADDARSARALHSIYETFDCPIHVVSTHTAEFVKYTSNALLATLVSFANEMSIIADNIGGIDVKKAFQILHQDRRWYGNPANMSSYVFPGVGYGGYCLPKDTEALYMLANAKGVDAVGLRGTMETNDRIKKHLVEKMAQHTSRSSTIGILGLSFKPNSDDVRETAAKGLIEELLAQGFTNLAAYDPMASAQFDAMYRFPIRYLSSFEEIAQAGDVFVIATAWDEFKRDKSLLADKPVYDFRYYL